MRHDEVYISEYILAVIGKVRSDNDLICGIKDHQPQSDKEIPVGNSCFKCFHKRNIFLFLFCCRNTLCTDHISIHKYTDRNDRIAGSYQDPGHLLIAGNIRYDIDQRQCERSNDHTCCDRQYHADVTDHITFTTVTAHQRSQCMEWLADSSVYNRIHDIIGNKSIDDLSHISHWRHGEQKHRCQRIRNRKS